MKFRPYLLAAATGIALFFVFPNFLGIELWPLAWIVLAPLLIALCGAESVRQSAKIAGFSGLAGYPLLYHWLVYTMNTYGQMSMAVSVSVMLALVAVLSLFMAGFGALHFYLAKKSWLPPLLAAPLAWTVMEFGRAHFPFGGFPWAFMANSQVKFLQVIQFTEWTGPYGLTFLIVLVNAGIAAAIGKRLPADQDSGNPPLAAALRPLLPGAMAFVLAAAYGVVRMPMVDRAFADESEVKIGIVQGNIDQGVKWNVRVFWETLDKHIELTGKLLPEKPLLIMWPEASITVGDFNVQWKERSRIIRKLEAIDAYLLVGSISEDPCDKNRRGICYYNSVFLLSPQAENMLGRYDKMRLVPFSEYVPMSKLFFFADAIAQGHAGSTTPGDEVKVMQLPGLNLGCVICYEVIFPHIVRRFVNQGADFMTTITNDAWFGKTGAPYQHHSNLILRAVENRVWFARSANTGISSVVDPNGRLVHPTDLYVEDAFIATVKASPIHTFYTHFGDVFAWSALVLSVLAIAGAKFSGKALETAKAGA